MTEDIDHPRSDRSSTARLVVAALLIVAVIAVALDNRQEVEVGYVIGSASAPVWVVLVAAALAGVVIGWLVKHRPGRNRN